MAKYRKNSYFSCVWNRLFIYPFSLFFCFFWMVVWRATTVQSSLCDIVDLVQMVSKYHLCFGKAATNERICHAATSGRTNWSEQKRQRRWAFAVLKSHHSSLKAGKHGVALWWNTRQPSTLSLCFQVKCYFVNVVGLFHFLFQWKVCSALSVHEEALKSSMQSMQDSFKVQWNAQAAGTCGFPSLME